MHRLETLETHLPHTSTSQAQGKRVVEAVLPLSTLERSLAVNLDMTKYGVFCEIGAGQEVARFFFHAGGASGTIAKSMSAYDKDVSDAIYGPEPNRRYVTRGRLKKMLEREYDLLVERMPEDRATRTQYFAFADTVAAKSYKGVGECHGWMGVRAQLYPGAAPSEIILHCRMLDARNQQQQEALGILGVNLIYAFFYLKRDPHRMIDSLLDNVGRDRLEIDMVQLSGPYFSHLDQRVLALHLLESGLSDAVLFNPSGEVVNPSDTLYKKHVVVLRGRFRPVTKVAVDMHKCSLEMFRQENPDVPPESLLSLAEISTRQLETSGGKGIDVPDFLSRVDILCSLGMTVLVSSYLRFFRLRSWVSRYTRRQVYFCMSVFNVLDLFEEKYYEGLDGGILEAMGRLFSGNVKLLVYPRVDPKDESKLITADTLHSHGVEKHLVPLFQFLRGQGKLVGVQGYDPEILSVDTGRVLEGLLYGEGKWSEHVPTDAAKLIRERRLFGYGSR